VDAVVDKSGDRVRRMFGEIAQRYDLLNHTLSGGIDRLWRRKTIRLVPPEGAAPILDVCTGTGDLALAYARAAAGRCEVVGTDFTAEMLEFANRKRDSAVKAGRLIEGRVSFLEADTLSLPFEAERFQIVSVAFGLRNVSNTSEGLREMVRVCQTGGRVAVLEFSKPRNRVFNAVYQRYFRTMLPKIGQLISGSREAAYNYLPQSVAEFPCGEELAAIMRTCGLEDVRFVPFTGGIATLYWGRKSAAVSHADG
jgi:demethylmenaquinone methyltransferase/2-methoxy-6-polyprenyl-1,4-benzoquinol methylase